MVVVKGIKSLISDLNSLSSQDHGGMEKVVSQPVSLSSLSGQSSPSCVMFCDGGYIKANGSAAAGSVLISGSRSILDTSISKIQAASTFVAEAMAVRNACLLRATRGLTGLIICSDSKVVISLASSDLDPPWEVEAIIRDIREMASLLGFVFKFVPRSCNCIAHFFVKAALRGLPFYNWVSSPPAKLRLLLDRLD